MQIFPAARGFQNGDLLVPGRQDRQVTGQGPSFRAEARDLGMISPFGRNDNALPFARDIPSFGCGFAALRSLWLNPYLPVQ